MWLLFISIYSLVVGRDLSFFVEYVPAGRNAWGRSMCLSLLKVANQAYQDSTRKKMNEVLAKKAGKGNVLSDCSTKPKERLDEIGMRITMRK